MIYYHNTFFSKEECESCINDVTEFKPALSEIRVGENKTIASEYSDFRNSTTCTVSYEKGSPFYNSVAALFREINTTLISDSIDLMMNKYSIGGTILRHTDENPNFPNRRYGVVLQMSEGDSYEGGDFNMYVGTELPEVLIRDIGSVAIFDNNLQHEVTKVISGNRISGVIFIDNDDIVTQMSAI